MFIITQNLKAKGTQAQVNIVMRLQCYDTGVSQKFCKSTKHAVILVLITQFVVVYSCIMCFPESEELFTEILQNVGSVCLNGMSKLPWKLCALNA